MYSLNEMFRLSKEGEDALNLTFGELFSKFLKNHEKIPPRVTRIITKNRVKQELEVSDNTLAKWERMGLKRYQAPGEDVRKIFYLVDDLHRFLGVEDG